MEEVGIYRLSEDGYIKSVGGELIEILGYKREEIIDSHLDRFLGEEAIEWVEEKIRQFQQDDHDHLIDVQESTLETSEGEMNPVEIYLMLRSGGKGQFESPAIIVRNITDRKENEQELKRYRSLTEALADEVYTLDPEGYFTSLIPPAGSESTILNYQPKELIGEHVSKLLKDETDIARAESIIEDLLESDEQWWASFEADLITKEEERIPCEIRLALLPPEEDGSFAGTIGVVRDISERKKLQEKLRHQALHDELTGLPNRRLLVDRLRLAQREADRSGEGFGIIFLDIDDLKAVNDTLGHSAGDDLLKAVAGRLRETLRDVDTVARFGGDEFVILLKELEEPEVIDSVLTRIKKVFEEPIQLTEETVPVSASLGVCRGSHSEEDPQRYIDQAEEAMRRADRTAGTSSEWTSIPEAEDSNGELPLRLEQALREEELTVYYQPILNLRTKAIAGLEALLRWDHPHKGILQAKQFIKELETSHVMNPVGRFVTKRICQDLHRWHDGFLDRLTLGMHRNLSVRRLFHSDLVEELLYCQEGEHSVDAGAFALEVTESALLVQKDQAFQKLRELSELGFSIVLDDFGTGYSSLTYLHRWPVDGLKIDTSFVSDFSENPNSRIMVQSILSLGERLEINIVPEGIENELTRSSLKEEGCHYGQGYFLGKPMSPQALEEHYPKTFSAEGTS